MALRLLIVILFFLLSCAAERPAPDY